jgi:hypothetical protein
MDRRLHGPQEAPGVVVFRDGWGEIAKRFELDELGLPADVTALLGTAFAGHHAGSTPDTQRGCWRALKTFATFAAEDRGIGSAADLRSAMIGRYMACSTGSPGSMAVAGRQRPRPICSPRFGN